MGEFGIPTGPRKPTGFEDAFDAPSDDLGIGDLNAPDLNVGVFKLPPPAAPLSTTRPPLPSERPAETVAPDDTGTPDLRELMLQEQRTALMMAQRQRQLQPPPTPQEAAALRAKSEAAGLPFSVAAADPALVGTTPDPRTPAWEDHADLEKPAVPRALLDPEARSLLTDDDVEKLVKTSRAVDSRIPTTVPGAALAGGLDQDERARIWFSIGAAGGKVSPEQQADLDAIKERAGLAPKATSGAGKLASAVLEQVPRMGRQVVIGTGAAFLGTLIGTPAVGAAMASGAVLADSIPLAVGDVFAEATEAGIPYQVAWPLSLFGGLIISGLDTVSAGQVSKVGLPVLKNLGGANFKAALKAAWTSSARFREVVKDMVTEGTTEGLQEVVQILDVHAGAAISGKSENLPSVGDELAARVPTAVGLGAAVGGAFSGATTAGRSLLQRKAEGTWAESVIEGMYAATEDLEVATTAPDVLHRFAKDLEKQGSVQTVTLPTEQVVTLFQKADGGRGKEMPEPVRKAVEAAQKSGSRTALQFADFLTYVRPLDEAGSLKKDIGLNDSMSPREAKELDPAIKRAQKEIEAMRKDVAPEGRDIIVREVATTLQKLGRSPEAATAQAEIFAAGQTALARRLNMDPLEFYRANPVDITGLGTAKTQSTQRYLAERLVAMTPEARAREYLIDTNTGLPNDEALAIRSLKPGEAYVFADPQGIAFLNDEGAGHGQGDTMMQSHARTFLGLGAEVYRAAGGFVAIAPDTKTAEAWMKKANAAPEVKGFDLEYRIGTEVSALKKDLDAWKAVQKEIAEGTREGKLERAIRGKRPLGADQDIEPSKFSWLDQTPRVELTEEQRALHTGMTAEQAYRAYVDPLNGVLKSRGWAVARKERKRKFLMSGDAAGIGVLDRKYGKEIADQVIQQIEDIVGAVQETMGIEVDAAHPHGDEIMAQFDSAKELNDFGNKLADRLYNTVFEVYDPANDEVLRIQGIAFAFGVHQTEKGAESGLNADKARLVREGKRDPKNVSERLDARISRRPADAADQDNYQRATDLGAGRKPGGSVQADGEVVPRGELALPGFTDLYAGNVVLGDAASDERGSLVFPESRAWFRLTLSGKANFSTFLHESGHYFLEMMRKYASESPAIAADLAVLEKWTGTEPGGKWSVEALEKFAKGFEQYILEGRAPSTRLERAFATAVAWMRKVYQALVGTGVELAPEVRGTMDRLIATDEEISGRQLELGYFPQDEAGMTSEWVEAYRAKMTEALDRAKARYMALAMKEQKRELSEEYKQIKEETEAEVALLPVVVLRDFIAGKGVPKDSGYLAPEFLHTPKLNAAAVEAMTLPPGVKSKLKEYLDPNGEDPSFVAPFFRYRNAGEMLVDLARQPSQATLVSRLVKEEMTKRHPGYGLTPAWKEQEALRVLHEEDGIAQFIEMELAADHMRLGAPPPQSAAQVADAAARSATLQTRIADLTPEVYRRAEESLLRERMKALAAKDFQAAAEATRKRLFARAMYRHLSAAKLEAERVRSAVERLGDRSTLARLGKSSKLQTASGKTLGAVIRDAARVIAEGTGLVPESEASKTGLAALLADIDSVAGAVVAVDPTLHEQQIPKWESEATVIDAQMIGDALKSLNHLASDANKVRVFQEKVEIEGIADEVVANLRDAKILDRLGAKGEEASLLRQMRMEAAKPETLAIDLDGGKPGGIFHRFWIGSAEQGQFEQDRRNRMRRADLRELQKKHRPERWGKRMRAKHLHPDGREYTGAQVFAMLLNLGTESGRTKLVEGMTRGGRENWTLESTIDFIHQVFPEQEVYAYAQAHLDYISQANLWDDSARVAETLAGVRPKKLPAVPIPTPDGTMLEGGYYPVIYDRFAPLKDSQMRETSATDLLDSKVPLNLFAAKGHTFERTGYVAPLKLDPTALAAHLYEVDHFISHAEGIVARHRLLNHPRIRNAIIASAGNEVWTQLHESNNFIATDGRVLTREKTQFDRLMEKMFYHNALLVMGGNILSGINQVVSGVPATLTYLGPRGPQYFAKALTRFARNPLKMWEEVNEASGEIQGMSFHYDRDTRLVVQRGMTGGDWETLKSQIAATTMTPVVFGQKVVNIITWRAAFDMAVADGKTDEEAKFLANTAVRQSQSTSGPKDFTAYQRSKNGLTKVLTTLASYTFTLNDLVMPRRLTQREIAGHTTRLVALITLSAVTKALFDMAFPKIEEDEEERESKFMKEADEALGPILGALFRSSIDNAVANVPLVGRPVAALASGRSPRFTNPVGAVIDAVEAAPDLFSDKGLSKRQVKAAADAVGLAVGIPTRHLMYAPGEFVYEYLNGNVEDAPWALIQELAFTRPGQKGD